MPKGIPNRRYTGEFKQKVVEIMQKEKLEEKNLFELRIIGSEMGVKGVSRLKKEDLIKSILDKSTEITRLYYSKQKKTPNENKLDILLKDKIFKKEEPEMKM